MQYMHTYSEYIVILYILYMYTSYLIISPLNLIHQTVMYNLF